LHLEYRRDIRGRAAGRRDRRALPPLPALIPELPAPGAGSCRSFAGSSDALALADSPAAPRGRRMIAVVSADPLSAQRLAEEIPWFAPELRVALLPTGKRCRTTTFRRTRTSCPSGSRRCIARRAANATCLSSPATTALYRLAPPSYLAAFTFFLTQGETLDVDALRAQLALAGVFACNAGRLAGRVQHSRGLIDLFPMGSTLTVPHRSLR
jgi:transcription-repair coupling factor (superfamily II helicase)